jgi:phosphomannomutase
MNFTVADAGACLESAEAQYGPDAMTVDHLDGVSIAHENWRFNLRKSNTEPLVRLNVETRGDADLLAQKTAELTQFIEAQAA